MAKAKRVFEIAKELGVASKVIVTKCNAEGVPGITNHMSAVKIGLEQTIREWFSEESVSVPAEAPHTAVETSAKVDLTKARRARRRKKAPEAEEVKPAKSTAKKAAKPAAALADAGTQAVAAASDEVAVAGDAAAVTEAVAAAESEPVIVGDSPEPTAAAGEPVAATPTPQAGPPEPVGPVGKPNVPSRPDVVKPMGSPLEKPKEAVLKGPQVVRIERPDPVHRPPPRSSGGSDSGGGRGGAGATRPAAAPARGGGGGPYRGRGGPADAGRGAATKRRSLSTRRGRSAEAMPVGPSKFSEQDLIELDARLNRAAGFVKQRRRSMKKQSEGGVAMASPATTGGKVEIAEPITIKTLSAVTGIKSAEVIKYLFKKGVMATINSAIDSDAALEVALDYGIELEIKEQQTAEQLVLDEFENREEIDVRARPPIVTVLGHVDHGKTSLLDSIRSADVAGGEAGGITQHVGAHRVTITGTDGQQKTVVFLDTPGHEAFTTMRARGAKLTDLVVLVVAADDGVMPQTIESINHAKAAEVPIIVAMNKIDKAEATEANIRKIYGQLAEQGLNPVEWGGTTEVVKVSATERTGVTELLEILDYQAELLELTADYGGAARGTVIESEMQPGRGPVARVLVEQGFLKVGDFIVIGRAFGRVRDMTDEHGKQVTDAGPATPLELSGIDLIPDAGDKFYITDSLQRAEQVAKAYRETERDRLLASKTKVTLDNFADTIAAGGTKELRVVLKADVQGSIDVLKKSLAEPSNDEVAVKVLHAAVGGITEGDVLLADASDAVVLGFHVSASAHARDLAEQRHVDIRIYKVIYDVIDSVRKALEGMLEPETKDEVLGEAEVRQVFRISKLGQIAGCLVTEGSIQRNGLARLLREDVVVTEGRAIENLKRVKDDAKEVRAGTECGIRLEGFDDVKPGDRVVCYKVVTITRRLE